MTAQKLPQADDRPEAAAFDFRTKPGGTNYGECAGIYSLSEGDVLNGKPVYVNEETENFLGFNGSTWVITGLAQKDRIVRDQKKGFKGFHAGGAGAPDDPVWGQYVVCRRLAAEAAPEPDAGVRIQGLVSAQDLNGAAGVCQGLDPASGRWQVRLESGELKLLKAENLLVCSLPPPELRRPAPPAAADPQTPGLPDSTAAEAVGGGRLAVAAEEEGSGRAQDTRQSDPLQPAAQRPSLQDDVALSVPGTSAPAAAQAAPASGLLQAGDIRRELEQVREAKRAAAQEEDFRRAKELRTRELELEARLREVEALDEAPAASHVPAVGDGGASAVAKEEGKKPQPHSSGGGGSAGMLRLLDSRPEVQAGAAEKAGEVALLYEERAELAAQRQRLADADKDSSQREALRQQEEDVEGRIAVAEATALAGLAAAVSGLRAELDELELERRRAWRAEEEELVDELEQRRKRLQAKLQRLEAAAERAAAAAEAAPPQPPPRRVAPSGAGGPPGAAAGPSLMRKLQQHRAAASTAPATCASCGAAAEQRGSPDGLRYCSWCWEWWDSQLPSAEASAAAPVVPVGALSARAHCFWDEKDAAPEKGADLQRPKLVPLVAHGASATGGGMRLLAAAEALAGTMITEEEAAAIVSELPREGMDEQKQEEQAKEVGQE